MKIGVVEEGDDKKEQDEDKRLALSVVPIHWMAFYALIDSGATPKVSSLSVEKLLSLNAEGTKKW